MSTWRSSTCAWAASTPESARPHKEPMERDRIAAIVREHAAEIRARGVTRLDLFGSVARGEGGEASDIDIVVDVAPG
ncbi:MAG: nucleotidyltransferase family protein, partial [Alphaproteobacteria bacterium]